MPLYPLPLLPYRHCHPLLIMPPGGEGGKGGKEGGSKVFSDVTKPPTMGIEAAAAAVTIMMMMCLGKTASTRRKKFRRGKIFVIVFP